MFRDAATHWEDELMPLSPEDRRALEKLFGEGVQEQAELSLRLIVLPAVALPPGCQPEVCMAIYVASAFQGYDSRLYLESPITLPSGNCPPTTAAVLLGRTLYAASIQGVSPSLPPHQAVLAHLQRYNKAEL